MFRLCEKIKAVRMALVVWSSRVMGRSSTILNEKLATIDALKQANGDGHHGDQLQSIKKEVDELLLRDKVYWRQRTRAIWLAVGDKNTKFFTNMLVTARKRTKWQAWRMKRGCGTLLMPRWVA